MRMLSYVFETSLRFSEPVVNHSFVLRCLPKPTNTQTIMESQVFTNPNIHLDEQTDGFGNRIVCGYCPEPHTTFEFYSSGLAMVDQDHDNPVPAHPMFLQPTPLTAPSEEIGKAASAVVKECFAGVEDAGRWALAQALNSYVHEVFEYAPGATDTTTSASDAFRYARGVCQDYSHVLISLCRVLGIPARYVNGLMKGEGATHAWVEVHDGVRWRGLDPTNDRVVNDDYLLFCTGRDFMDCPIERGVFNGNATQTQIVTSSVGEQPGAVDLA